MSGAEFVSVFRTKKKKRTSRSGSDLTEKELVDMKFAIKELENKIAIVEGKRALVRPPKMQNINDKF